MNDIKPGDSVDIIGSMLAGHPGIVLTDEELSRLGASKRGGLIPVYTPQFPATAYWWLHPNQVRKAVDGQG